MLRLLVLDDNHGAEGLGATSSYRPFFLSLRVAHPTLAAQATPSELQSTVQIISHSSSEGAISLASVSRVLVTLSRGPSADQGGEVCRDVLLEGLPWA